MGTTFETPTLAAAFKVLAACDRVLAGCERLSIQVKIDRRAGGMGRLNTKVETVQLRLPADR